MLILANPARRRDRRIYELVGGPPGSLDEGRLAYLRSVIAVQYPEPSFRIRREGAKPAIFDPIRRSWVALTEEEWVRQNFLQYLIQVLGYPAAVIAVEKEIRVHELRKRFDILIYDDQHLPWMLVECKEPQVPLSEEVLQQVLRYHLSLPVPFLVITNGSATIAWTKQGEGLMSLTQLPLWPGTGLR